jgi:membrane protein
MMKQRGETSSIISVSKRRGNSMQLNFIQFLIVCPLVFLAGFVDAIAGGGGLISLPAYLISGIPIHMAIGTNKLSGCLGTGLTTYRFAKKGYIPYKIAFFAGITAFIGASLGAKLSLIIEEEFLLKLMLVILPLTAWYVIRGVSFEKEALAYSFKETVVRVCMVAFVVAVYDGFYGPGAGTFMLLLLVLVGHLNIKEANGVAKAINLATNVAALTVFFLHGKVLLPLGLMAGVFGILGNYMGSKVFMQGEAKWMKPMMIIVLVIFFIRVVIQLMGI